MKLGIIFGGKSNEHEVSIVSATSIIKNLDKEKYDITPIYLDWDNEFYIWTEDISLINPLPLGSLPTKLEKVKDIVSFLKGFDCIFIMIHGQTGEDGSIANLLDFLNIPYVGNKPAPSIITMDKVYTKMILEQNHIKTSPYLSFRRYNKEYILNGEILNFKKLLKRMENNLLFPVFVKPANSGSSKGITRVVKKEKLKEAIELALTIDDHVLIEEEIVAKELECAILEENGKILASVVGEIIANDEFYSFDAKYNNKESITLIPANISKEDEKRIQDIAKTAFKVLGLQGYSRIDFFLTSNHSIYLNEINTIPGFTSISMYPKLLEARGIPYSKLLDILISEKCRK